MQENAKFTKHRKNKYTTINNILLQDGRLSYDAVGILVYLLSNPNDCTDIVTSIKERNCTSEYAVRKALRLLKECGYITWDRAQSGFNYTISDTGDLNNKN